MRFYTNFTTHASNYCLTTINYFNRSITSKLDTIIDPGVHELRTCEPGKSRPEYKMLAALEALANEKPVNESYHISIDYPPDMNPVYSEIFKRQSYENCKRFHHNYWYIITPQFRCQDFDDFITSFENHQPFISSHTWVGIGNLCRILYPNEFTDLVFYWLAKQNFYHLHFYGLGFRLIQKYLNTPSYFDLNQKDEISVDNTKWTRAITVELKHKYGAACRKATRDLYFHEYMKRLGDNWTW